MYVLKPGIKADARRRWALPDRIFFGHGACHILAGVYLVNPPLPGFWAEKITPRDGFPGSHLYVTDGRVAFDYHGYSARSHLLAHHARAWSVQYAGWTGGVDRVDYDLLSTMELNRRKMLGPEQYLMNPVPRARRFIERVDHPRALARASKTIA